MIVVVILSISVSEREASVRMSPDSLDDEFEKQRLQEFMGNSQPKPSDCGTLERHD